MSQGEGDQSAGTIPQMDGFCDESANESEEDAINIDNLTDENCVKSLRTNARSIMPKTDLLVDAFNSSNLHLACITETWYRGGAALPPPASCLKLRC